MIFVQAQEKAKLAQEIDEIKNNYATLVSYWKDVIGILFNFPSSGRTSKTKWMPPAWTTNSRDRLLHPLYVIAIFQIIMLKYIFDRHKNETKQSHKGTKPFQRYVSFTSH